ncbi:hypothetical protein SLA2020_316510 [Shorea laevis]
MGAMKKVKELTLENDQLKMNNKELQQQVEFLNEILLANDSQSPSDEISRSAFMVKSTSERLEEAKSQSSDSSPEDGTQTSSLHATLSTGPVVIQDLISFDKSIDELIREAQYASTQELQSQPDEPSSSYGPKEGQVNIPTSLLGQKLADIADKRRC